MSQEVNSRLAAKIVALAVAVVAGLAGAGAWPPNPSKSGAEGLRIGLVTQADAGS